MSQFSGQPIEGRNFSAVQIGIWNDLLQHQIIDPFKTRGKLFLKDQLR